jgi:WD40 repeat protein
MVSAFFVQNFRFCVTRKYASEQVTELPVRAAKFIARKQWIVTGSDDLNIRVFNYNTMEKIKTFEAHTDYLRYVAVHPSLPYILTCSDDMTIKMWDWDKNWECKQTYEGHSHYVMQVWTIFLGFFFSSAVYVRVTTARLDRLPHVTCSLQLCASMTSSWAAFLNASVFFSGGWCVRVCACMHAR